jgi:hypothetical protein
MATYFIITMLSLIQDSKSAWRLGFLLNAAKASCSTPFSGPSRLNRFPYVRIRCHLLDARQIFLPLPLPRVLCRLLTKRFRAGLRLRLLLLAASNGRQRRERKQ